MTGDGSNSGSGSVEEAVIACWSSVVVVSSRTSTDLLTPLDSRDGSLVSWIVTVGEGGCCCLGGGDGVVDCWRRSRTAEAGPCRDRLPLEPLERRQR